MNTPDTKAAPTGHAGSPRIAAVFAEKARQGRAALIPYVTAGFPEPEQALAVLRALVAGGADIIELGVPFSDPAADGPTIQRANDRALAAGMSLTKVLALEWGEDGIRVNSISPGPIGDTEGMRRLAPTADALERAVSTVPLLRMGSTDDVAHMALFLSSELASYVTGAIIPVDGGAALRGGRDMRASYVPRSAA